ncbi:MAG: HAD family hydrolase [Nitrospiraceae bacterium]|nr:HAD family hydrolase [Nitrospiraceae bacterium]
MKKRGAVLFDLYGTLIDIETNEEDLSVYSALSKYLSYYQVRIGPEDLKAAYFGEVSLWLRADIHREVDVFEIFKSIMQRHGEKGKKFPPEVVFSATVLFRSLTMRRFGLFPGVKGFLEEASENFLTALVSDAQWPFAEPELAMLGLESYFRSIILSSRIGHRKPDPRPFEAAMKELKVRPEDCIYIGDSPERDLQGARNAGIRCVLFGRGPGPFGGLSPEASFNSYAELYSILPRLFPA